MLREHIDIRYDVCLIARKMLAIRHAFDAFAVCYVFLIAAIFRFFSPPSPAAADMRLRLS